MEFCDRYQRAGLYIVDLAIYTSNHGPDPTVL